MPSDPNRRRRVAELVKRELASLIQHELHDPRVHGITITDVEISPDLSSAKVYFTSLGGDQAVKQSTAALNRAARFLRHHLMDRLVLRGVPQLRFMYDDSVEKGAALSGLIERAVAEDGKPKAD
ncbi:MAG: 30S ribosome-binding factor RbfA [Acidiferrobacterales bacterium]